MARKIIEPDPDSAPLIARLFEWYATGTLSLKEAAEKARAAGLVYRKSGAQVPVSTVHTISAQSPLYGRVRMERSYVPWQASALDHARIVGARSGRA